MAVSNVTQTHPLLQSRGNKPRKGRVYSCDWCSVEFYRSPCRVLLAAKYSGVFCSRRCTSLNNIADPLFHGFLPVEGQCVRCGDIGKKMAWVFICQECCNKRSGKWKREHPAETKAIRTRYVENYKATHGGMPPPTSPPTAGYYQTPKWKAMKREYFQQNKAAFNRRGQEWREKNPERVKEMSRKSKSKPEAKLRNRLRQAIRHSLTLSRADGSVTKEAVKTMLAAQQGLCLGCDADIRERFELDHIIPLSKNGMHTISNIQLLCRSCNVRKSNKIISIVDLRAKSRDSRKLSYVELLEIRDGLRTAKELLI